MKYVDAMMIDEARDELNYHLSRAAKYEASRDIPSAAYHFEQALKAERDARAILLAYRQQQEGE